MFKDIISGFSKFFTKGRTVVLLIFLVLAWALFSYSGSKMNVFDQMGDGSASVQQIGPIITKNPHSAGPPSDAQMDAPTTDSAVPNGYAKQNVANPSDLLPKDANSQWSALNPSSMNKGDVLMPDLLQAGYHIGLDTIGQTLRNPNLQLRSDPVIQKADIGPWNQSTIEPDYGRVPLELGVGPK
jgi:hypothetical protein